MNKILSQNIDEKYFLLNCCAKSNQNTTTKLVKMKKLVNRKKIFVVQTATPSKQTRQILVNNFSPGTRIKHLSSAKKAVAYRKGNDVGNRFFTCLSLFLIFFGLWCNWVFLICDGFLCIVWNYLLKGVSSQ